MLSNRPRTRAELVDILQSHPRLRVLYAEVRKSEDGDAAHDPAHLLRVALWTMRIGGEAVDPEEAVAAALLHDFVNVPKNHPDRARASEFSAEKARGLLTELGYSPDSVDRVCTAIRQHSFSRGEIPTEPLAQALQDADRLEALGAIGLMRLISTGVRMGARYFHPDDPWAKRRELDDRAYSVDHFFTKLLKLPASMTTAAGREEAQRRARTLEHFLGELAHELGEDRA